MINLARILEWTAIALFVLFAGCACVMYLVGLHHLRNVTAPDSLRLGVPATTMWKEV